MRTLPPLLLTLTAVTLLVLPIGLPATLADPAGHIAFLPPVSYAVPGAGDVATRDFDGDSLLDLAVYSADRIGLLYGRGDGTFEAPVYHPAGNVLNQIIGVDVNTDGRLDLVATHTNGNRVAVLINSGGRAFAAAAYYPVGNAPFGVTAGDFNGDGSPDLAAANDNSHNMSVLLNLGNGTFSPATTYGGGSFPARVLSADLNGDGHADLAMSNYVSENVLIYFGNGAGGFTGGGSYRVGSYPAQIIRDDFNGDGKIDLATANTFSHNISLLFGDGQGRFTVSPLYPGNTYPHFMGSADLDGDGDPDLATPNNGTDYFSVLVNVNGGELTAPVRFPSGGENTRTLAIGDFNRDGRPDVAVGNESSNNVCVCLNATPFPEPAPAAPSDLKAQTVSATQIDLTWNDNSGNETGFEVERKSGTGGFTRIHTTGPNATTHADTGLTPKTVYFYRVRAVNSRPSGYSNEASATTLPNPPSAPSGLSAAAVSQFRIDLSWTDTSNDEQAFEVERKTGAGDWVPVGGAGANGVTFSDTGLSADTTYVYRVRATNAGGASPYSNEAMARTLREPPAPPAAPTELAAAVLGRDRIRLTWRDNSSDEALFRIERSTEGGQFAEVATRAANATDYLSDGLMPRTAYSYRVRASNDGGHSAYSNTAGGTTLPNPPAMPANPRVTFVSATQVTIAWDDSSTDETGFEVERRVQGGFGGSQFVTPANTVSLTNTGLKPDTTYLYRIRAVNGGGGSAFTPNVSARTLPNPPAAPSGLAAQALSPTEVRLTWTDGSANEDGFSLERSDDGLTFAEIATPAANATSHGDGAVAAGATYHYRLRARNAGGESPYSNTATVTMPASAPDPPGAPGNLTATIVTATEVRLAWTDGSTDETGFRIERRVGGGEFTTAGSTGPNVLSFASTGLVAGTSYTFRVRATRGQALSAPSNEATVTIAAGGRLRISPARLNFGKRRVGTSRTLTLRLTNSGSGPLSGTIGTLAAPYTVSGGPTFTLAPRASVRVSVRFAPGAAGSYPASLEITSTDPARARAAVGVTGTGR